MSKITDKTIPSWRISDIENLLRFEKFNAISGEDVCNVLRCLLKYEAKGYKPNSIKNEECFQIVKMNPALLEILESFRQSSSSSYNNHPNNRKSGKTNTPENDDDEDDENDGANGANETDELIINMAMKPALQKYSEKFGLKDTGKMKTIFQMVDLGESFENVSAILTEIHQGEMQKRNPTAKISRKNVETNFKQMIDDEIKKNQS